MVAPKSGARATSAGRPGLRSSSRMSGPGMARRQQMLNTARKMLQTTRLADLSLGDIAKRAKVGRGSAYFFYEDVNSLCAALIGVVDGELQAVLREPLGKAPGSWQEIVNLLIDRGCEFLDKDFAACQLLVGRDAPPALKLIDRANDVVLGRIIDEQIASRFELPPMPDRPKLFFRALELVDVMLCLSMIEHGRLTKEYIQEASRAAIAYLGTYLPPKLPTRKA
jgi:AcrR family transcriptional regulator